MARWIVDVRLEVEAINHETARQMAELVLEGSKFHTYETHKIEYYQHPFNPVRDIELLGKKIFVKPKRTKFLRNAPYSYKPMKAEFIQNRDNFDALRSADWVRELWKIEGKDYYILVFIDQDLLQEDTTKDRVRAVAEMIIASGVLPFKQSAGAIIKVWKNMAEEQNKSILEIAEGMFAGMNEAKETQTTGGAR